MFKCRICLNSKRTMISIYESARGITFKDIMTVIANVKIKEDDGITDKICVPCSRKLIDSYDLKVLIEQSDNALYETKKLKKVIFNNLDDMKIKIEVNIQDMKLIRPKCENFDEHFRNGASELCYSNTVIKKLEKSDCLMKPVAVLEFLKTIKEESNDCMFDDDYYYNDQENYEPQTDSEGDETMPVEMWTKEKYRRKSKRKRNKKKYEIGSDDEESLKTKKKCDEYNEDGYVPKKKKKDDDDEEYIPINLKVPKRKYKKRETTKTATCKPISATKPAKCKPGTITYIKPLKPIIMSDLRLISAQKKLEPGQKKKYILKKPPPANPTICPYCGVLTKTLNTHLLVHTGERKFRCDQCDKAYFSSAQLEKHSVKHTGIMAFKCDQCTAKFYVKGSLRSHMLSHTKERKHICHICSKSFKRKGALLRHMLQHSAKTVMCDLCNMSFSTKDGLRHHMRVHTGERPFNCEICSQPYSYKHDFNRHCFKKHGVFLKRRSVYVMNEEVLKQEKILMRDLMLRVSGTLQDDKPLNPFEGPQAWQAFNQAVKALENRQIPIDFQL